MTANHVLFTGARVLDATGAPPFPGEVRVVGNRIREIARDGKALPPGDAEVIDAGGATLMPGLIESHSHVTFCDVATLEELGFLPPEEHTLKAMKIAKRLLDQGFTAANSAASAKNRLDVVIRNAIRAGDIPGPRMLAATPEMTVSGGLGDVRLAHMHRESFAVICDGADSFRRVAREFCREGVDTLKINPSGDELVPFARAHQTVMTDAEIGAVCEVARERDKRVAAHARSAESVKRCLRNGVEIIYHATLADEEARDLLEAQRDRVFVSPTIGITYTTLYEAGAWGLTPEVVGQLGLRRELEIAVENMKDLKKRGVRILPGGDYGFAWNPNGTNARDLEHFVKLLDFTPMEAIQAATKLGGQIMLLPDELGQVREGFLADLLLVDGDPLADIAILQQADRLRVIMQDGRLHKRPSGEARRAAVAAE